MSIKRALLAVFSLILIGGIAAGISSCSTQGQRPAEADLERISASPQWRGDRFGNRLPQEKVDRWPAFIEFFFGAPENSTPDTPVPVEKRQASDFRTPPADGLRVTWLGHSTFLIEIEGQNLLIDPVWSERASPFTWIGPKRFHPPPLALDALPPIDAVLISHDHYDHLDTLVVDWFRQKGGRDGKPPQWITPLGVGSHLKSWDIAPSRIIELDWWQGSKMGQVTVTAIPSRHTSGRSVTRSDVKKTLWSGFAINGPSRAVVYSGDTSMHDDFAEIGRRLGPFDLSIIETGAYNPYWRDNHLGPEQAVIAHRMLRARTMLPAHWATFELAPHGWTEPAERVLAAARQACVHLALPIPGGSIVPEPANHTGNPANMPKKWWPDTPWLTAEQKPVWSSRVEHLQKWGAEQDQVANCPAKTKRLGS